MAAIDVLQRELKGARRLDIASAFVSRGGVELLRQASRPGRTRLICRAGYGTTDPGAVLTAKEELGADVRLVTGPAAAHFHPKLYLVQHTERLVVLAGSGNLTRGGLRDNVEQFEQLSIKAGEKRERDHVTRFNKIWEQGVPLAELRETEFWEQWLEQWEQRSAIQRQAAELDAALDDSVPEPEGKEATLANLSGGEGWEKPVMYPIIARVVRELSGPSRRYVDRDRITRAVIADEEARPQVESAVDKQGRAAFKAAGNMVDWFSADFDRLPWSAEFDRRKQLVPSSSARRDPIWAYALKAEADS